MDWSLVLASQGIETWIEQLDDGRHWALVVEAQDYSRSVAAIRQYRLENRGWPWKYRLPLTGSLFHWGSVVWCAYLALVFWINARMAYGLESAGVMDKSAVLAGQWWRLFTAVSLHSGAAHLAANITFGSLLLGLAMARYGAGIALLSAYVSGACGNMAGLFLHDKPFHGLGASGMVMGALGLLAAEWLPLWRKKPTGRRAALTGALAALMLFVLLGLDPNTDVVAHAGGFAAGAFSGALLGMIPSSWRQHRAFGPVTFLLLIAIVGVTWGLALCNPSLPSLSANATP
jgi:membrane associated rhomboid family serine protease